MVLVSHKYKFIYIKNHKVAGSSVESFFGQYCIDPNKPYCFDDKIDEHIDSYGIIGSRLDGNSTIWQNHKTAQTIKKDLGEDTFNKYLKFCVVRNPYDILVSNYCWKKENVSFKEFCKTAYLNNFEIYSIYGKSICDYVIRYENLEEDIIKLCNILNIDNYNINLLPKHKSEFRDKNIHYREYYDDELKEFVYKKYKQEFDLYGYEF